MDAITLSLAISKGLDISLMDVVTTYLHGSIDTNTYMKILEGFKLIEATNPKPRNMYSIKLQRPLYELKQSGCMWYNRLSEYLLKEEYVNNSICPCVFIKKSKFGLTIIAMYVDDLNLIGTPKEVTKATNYLKKEFEMKDFGKTRYCICLQIKHCSNGILVHQSTYIEKVLKLFYIDKSHPLDSLMVVRSLEVKKDLFRPKEKKMKNCLVQKYYISAQSVH